MLAYLEAGNSTCVQGTVVEPNMQQFTVTVYRSKTDIIKHFTHKDTQTITGEDVVEGFSCPVAPMLPF